jgi:SulP family sulfate permease
LVASGVNFIDLEGADFLVEEAWRRRQAGGELYLYDLKEGVCEVFRPGGHLKEIGEQNVFESKTAAIEEIFDRLDREICGRCTRRIFLECRALPEPGGEGAAPAAAMPGSIGGGKE